MSEYLTLRTESGGEIMIERSPLEGRWRAKRAVDATLRQSLSGLNDIARDIDLAIRDMDRAPDEVKVTVGVQAGAGAQLVIAQAHTSAAMVFEFTWRRSGS